MMDQVDYNNCLECKKQEGIEIGIQQGLEQGLENGIAQQNLVHLKNMQDAHFSDEQIMMVLGVTADELLELRKNI